MITRRIKTALSIPFAVLFSCLTHLNGQAQNNINMEFRNYYNAKEFMQKEFPSKHNVLGWPELRSDWFVRIEVNEGRMFYEISGFDIYNEFLILHVNGVSDINKPNGTGSMYVLGKVEYLNINLNDTIELIRGETKDFNEKHNNIILDNNIKYKKYEIDHRGENSIDNRYKKNKNFDAFMVEQLYNHFLALKEYVKTNHINSDSLLNDFSKEFKKNNSPKTISEEQRKFIVQANAANDEHDYKKALELYKKAIKINAFSYPSAYYNMALIEAQINRYIYAIMNMKKYLMLVPESEDARSAQDKIYIWEDKFGM